MKLYSPYQSFLFSERNFPLCTNSFLIFTARPRSLELNDRLVSLARSSSRLRKSMAVSTFKFL